MQFSLKIHFHAPLCIPQTHQYLTMYLYRYERLRGIAAAKITSLPPYTKSIESFNFIPLNDQKSLLDQ